MIACVLIPYLAAAIERQQNPMLENVPVLLVKYGTKRSKIIAVSLEAAQTGAEAGMFLSRARGLCPTAHLINFEEQRIQQFALDPLLRLLWDYTNRVEVDHTIYPQTGVFYLDLGNLRDEDALYLGEKLQSAVRQQFHSSLSVSVGLASGKFPAYVAATTRTNQVTLVPRHQEGTFVAPCSTRLLPASKETARRLAILYVRQLGQLATLPREAVISQFGREGKLLYALAQGLDGRPVKPRRMPESETVLRHFEQPITDRTRLDVIIHHLADDLSRKLEGRNAALHGITLKLYFEPDKSRVEQLHLLYPIAGAAMLARTIQQLFERFRLSKGITGLEVSAAHLVPNIPKQLDLFSHKPGRVQIIDMARILATRHGAYFYEVTADESESLLPERRFRFLRVDAS